jgi:hypothetical protein
MVRSRWIKAVMATLVSTGIAWGQSAPKSPDDATGRVMTVQEAGKPAQRCRVVKWWVNDKGSKVWQVEALDTHEIMTIVAGSAPIVGEPSHARSLKTTIFHWRDRTPPPDAPLPPSVACDCGPSAGTAVAGTPIIENRKVVQAQPSSLGKLRESWGKTEASKLPEKKIVIQAQATTPLPKIESKKPDPLLGDPTLYAKKPLGEKLPPKSDLPVVTAATPRPASESIEFGGQSVVDSGATAYRAVPVVTLPGDGVHPPTPQQWQVPQAPQPIVNPGRGNAPEAHQGGIAYNAFTPTELTPPAPGSVGQAMLGNAFSSDLDCCPTPVPYGPPAGGVYGPPGPPKTLAMVPPGARPMNQNVPAAPYGPVVQLPPANAAGQGTGLMPASYQAPSVAPAGQTPQQLTAMLHDALYPSQRESAAEKLATFDWKQTDAAVQALTQAVRNDPAATVRAACIHSLARMKANTMPVVSAIQAAKNDADARVRTEAEEALAVLAPKAAAPAAPRTIQPVSAVSPAPLPALPPVK